MNGIVRIATRGSALARWQAERVAERLGGAAELVVVSTQGDRDRVSAIHEIGGTGVFVKEVQEAVLRGDADIAVHSAKDLPAITADGLVIGAVPERADVRDALVGARLAAVPEGGTIGTGAVRRRAQLAAVRPDLQFGELRGNVGTRVQRAVDFDAVVVALAPLERLGLTEHIAEILEVDVMLPMIGQGALAVECRIDDEAALDVLAGIDDNDARAALTAERAFLRELGGGCTMPCAAYATVDAAGVHLEALLASLDGITMLRANSSDTDPDRLGTLVARMILEERGGRALIDAGATS